MGEVADSLINGEICSWCNKWLEHPTGYPTICTACYKASNKGKKQILREDHVQIERR